MPGPKTMNVKPTANKGPSPKGLAGRAGKAGGAGGLKGRLAGLKAKWNERKESSKKGGFGEDFPGPDGKYLFKLTRAEPRESAGGLFFDFMVECVAGEFAGHSKDWGKNMEDEKQFDWLLRDLRKLGVDVDGMDDPAVLEEAGKELVANDTHLVCTIKQAGAYQNCNIVRAIDPSELDDLVAEFGGNEGGGATAPEPEPEPEQGGAEGEPIKPDGWKPAKGMRVVVQFDSTWYGGVINSCPPNAKACAILFDDGEQKSIPVEAIFPEPEAGGEGGGAEGGGDEPAKIGDNVWWSDDGTNEFTGEVKSAKGTTLMVKLDSGKMKPVDTSKAEVSVLA